LRHYRFLAEGIPDIADELAKRNVGFVLRRFPEHSLRRFCEEIRPALLVGDENPMREPESWRRKAARELKVPLWTVDADVIVPSKLLEKAQYAARIIRPRLRAHLKEFFIPFKNPKSKIAWKKPAGIKSLSPADDILEGWRLDRSVSTVSDIRGGSAVAGKLLHEFVTRKLADYPDKRNHPESDFTTRLSPYLHFGHISPLTIALAVQKAEAPRDAKQAFLDQLITWRELSINFVRFNPNYDNFECADAWAHQTLAEHGKDERPVRYSAKQMENAETYDPLWNAAQCQMANHGWMHNYVRMYWGKKILEWSASAAEAYETAVFLNDKYELDGRDPNGYAGIAWSIVGKFDRPWFDRPIFGKVRYMSLASTGKKFDSALYIQQNS
jgi:deoxyribodipyrimidine photo-lyase